MQVGHHNRHPAEIIRITKQVMVRRALLVSAQHGGLQRGVPGLDQVPVQHRVGRQPVRDGDHHRVTAGAEPQVQRGGVEQHPVAGLRQPGQRGVTQGAEFRTVDVD